MLVCKMVTNVSVEINLGNMEKNVDAINNAVATVTRNVEGLGEILFLRSNHVSTYTVYMAYGTLFGSLITYHVGINCVCMSHVIYLPVIEHHSY